jgi:hypothetical protein
MTHQLRSIWKSLSPAGEIASGAQSRDSQSCAGSGPQGLLVAAGGGQGQREAVLNCAELSPSSRIYGEKWYNSTWTVPNLLYKLDCISFIRMTSTKAKTRSGRPKAAVPATIQIQVPIPVESLPPLVSRTLAARFTGLHRRTLQRAEDKGLLKAIKRNARVVLYEKDDLLRYYGMSA